MTRSRTGAVLIETYWNVKSDRPGGKLVVRCGINRNILECKGKYYF